MFACVCTVHVVAEGESEQPEQLGPMLCRYRLCYRPLAHSPTRTHFGAWCGQGEADSVCTSRRGGQRSVGSGSVFHPGIVGRNGRISAPSNSGVSPGATRPPPPLHQAPADKKSEKRGPPARACARQQAEQQCGRQRADRASASSTLPSLPWLHPCNTVCIRSPAPPPCSSRGTQWLDERRHVVRACLVCPSITPAALGLAVRFRTVTYVDRYRPVHPWQGGYTYKHALSAAAAASQIEKQNRRSFVRSSITTRVGK